MSSGTGLWFLVLSFQVLLVLLVRTSGGYNLDTKHSLSFTGPTGSLFGYSVLLHRHRQTSWLVVGAPVDNVSSTPWVRSPGAIYRCRINTSQSTACQHIHSDMGNCGRTCEAESDDQWLGVSLSRHPTDGHMLACGHRWKNVFYSQKDSQNNKLPNGVCYRYGNDFRHAHPIIPCYRDHQRKFGEDYGSCQAGISNFLSEDLIIMGAPGTSYWTGSVLVYNTSSRIMSAYLDDDTVQFGSYLGYSVGAGHFLHPATTEVVGGAPQHSQTGKVFIFTVDDNKLRIILNLTGNQLGSYFGASVCAVDLNADGLSDLLVGAPMTTSTMGTGVGREEGRVHIYINQGEAKLLEAGFGLTGEGSYAARFGETIVDLGDLDHDGYHDVAVGAPHEEDLRGAIYIYNGRKEGISQTYSQRISGSVLGRDLRMFGQSMTSGIDIDDNGYQDVAVGAYLSDSAVILRARPVVRVEASLLLPDSFNHSVLVCQESGAPSSCLNLSVCFSVTSPHYRGQIGKTNPIENYENEKYLHDNAVSLLLPVRYGVDVSIHGFVNPSSFVFGDQEPAPADCFTETFNFTFKVLNAGPSRSVDTVVEVDLPNTLSPHPFRLLQLSDWQSSHGSCYISDRTISAVEDCDVPRSSFIKELIFFFSRSSTRRMFCGHGDRLCERLVCRLGNLEPGTEVVIQLETRVNPLVLQQSPGRHGNMLLESTAMMTSPREDPHTILLQPRPLAQVVVEAHFTQKPSAVVKVFIILISLLLGLLILAALIYCLWKAGFFKREFQKKEDTRRDSWDYVPKNHKREST
ncbi:integrin alpha-4 [Polymixia lowei]